LERFYDSEEGGFWQSVADSKDLIMRVKEDYDGAEPSGNSVGASCHCCGSARLRSGAHSPKPGEKPAAVFGQTAADAASRAFHAPGARL
jgi:uncharacterized protein YyaL (SSP411 family)